MWLIAGRRGFPVAGGAEVEVVVGSENFFESGMVFNVAALLEVVGWALYVCQVLACNPDILERNEVIDLLCCVPYHLMTRAFTSVLTSVRFRLATHLE